MGSNRTIKVVVAVAIVLAYLIGPGGMFAASADSCLSVDQTGVCFPTQNTTVVPSETAGGPVTTPGETVGGDITGGAVPINSPTQVCYLVGCIEKGQNIATVPDVSTPLVPVPSETAPVPQETTPAVALPFDPTRPYLEDGLPSLTGPAVGGGVLVGSGTISPGLSSVTSGTYQTFTFAGTGAVIATVGTTPVAGTITCSLSGNDTIGTVTQSAGNIGGACAVTNVTPAGGEPCAVAGSYTRLSTYETMNGTLNCGGTVPFAATFIGVCVYVPSSFPPITTYTVVCGYGISP